MTGDRNGNLSALGFMKGKHSGELRSISHRDLGLKLLGLLRIVLLWMGSMNLSLIENSNAIRN